MARFFKLLIFLVAFISKYDFVRSQCAAGECDQSLFDQDLIFTPDIPCHPDGTTVTFGCVTGVGGPPYNNCVGGSWVLPPSNCDVWTCTPPIIGDAVTLTQDKASYDTRETVIYGCDPGYTLTGTSSASCDALNVWNPTSVPICALGCDVPTIDNGDLSSTGPFGDGDTASITCDPGHAISSGSSTITCTEGVWSVIPECVQNCNVSGIANSDSPIDSSITHGATKTIDCSPGYSFDQKTTFVLGCDDGTITGDTLTQCYQDCTTLNVPDNGQVTGGKLHAETSTYSCDRGYLLNSTTTNTCNDGVWSDGNTPPTCYDKSLENSIVLFCNTDKFIVEIPLALLNENADVDSVLLGNCSGSVFDAEYMYANSSYTDCGTTMEVDNTARTITYRNELSTVEGSGPVSNVESLHLNIKCVFDQDNKISSSAVVQNSFSKDLNGEGNYQISFGIYTDHTFSKQITEADVIDTNDDLVILAQVVDVSELDVYPIKCYSTPDDAADATTFDLIINGCSVSSSYAIGLSTSEATVTNPHLVFDSKAFRFTGSSSDRIYFHCDLRICAKGDCPLPTTCGGSRRRRDITGSHLVVSKHVSAGPIKLHNSKAADTESSGVWQFTALTVYSATLSFLVLSVVAVLVVTKARRAARTPVAKTDVQI